MKSKRKIIIISLVFVLCAAIFLYLWGVHMAMKAGDLAMSMYNSGWQKNLKYSMLSDKLKKVISEEEFYDRSDSGKYNMYRKLEGLELEPTDKGDPSTDWWKSPPYDIVETDEGRFFIELRIDFKAHLTHVEVINIVPYIHKDD